ncbi:MAG: transketolase [Acidobacteria bacterium]|nr:transketolase [Acidobacteriota bacterium]
MFDADPPQHALEPLFPGWDVARDVTDQLIDLALNYRQSGHPGGSRSKAPALITLLLSGALRWDIRNPGLPFADRFVLAAGHAVPVLYATLATLHEALSARHAATHESRYDIDRRWRLTWEDLLKFRRRGGLPGHVEAAGKTRLAAFNSGPSGHGLAAAVGIALALERAGTGARVFVLEGEGGLTPGIAQEALSAAWGLGLDRLYLLLDWNDYGIDPRPCSSVVYGTPVDWLASRGWRVYGADDGTDWSALARALLAATGARETGGRPALAWFRTRKGRGYGKYDHLSHGAPHAMNSPEFWETKRAFQERYNVRFRGFGDPPPDDAAALREQARENFRLAASVIRDDAESCRAIADRLLEIAAAVPARPATLRWNTAAPSPWDDARLTDARGYPAEMWFAAGEKVPARAALARWGAWANSWARAEHGRPLFLAFSADLAESTGVIGFAQPFAALANYGIYDREHAEGVVPLQQITELCNAAMAAGIASVNLAADPLAAWDGLGAVHSSYGAFAYLQYGPMRLYSQLAQDSEAKVGPVIWVASHSGPETAEDSRSHFGVFAPSVTQLFPEGSVIDLHPWEANEIPVLLAAGLAVRAPIVALHLARPALRVPDRAALGIPSHHEAARGAYVLRGYDAELPRAGCVIVQGAATTNNVLALFPELHRRGLNVKIVAAVSPQLFARQAPEYRDAVLSAEDRLDAMGITNRARDTLRRWFATEISLEYTLSADWDDRWRTGGTVDEVIEEARLDPASLLTGIERFAAERAARLSRIERLLLAARC